MQTTYTLHTHTYRTVTTAITIIYTDWVFTCITKDYQTSAHYKNLKGYVINNNKSVYMRSWNYILIHWSWHDLHAKQNQGKSNSKPFITFPYGCELIPKRIDSTIQMCRNSRVSFHSKWQGYEIYRQVFLYLNCTSQRSLNSNDSYLVLLKLFIFFSCFRELTAKIIKSHWDKLISPFEIN